ncbi:hypothetical protein AVEN_261796-1 [Araneus ventricosus]|uniref:Baculoviridae p74 N-terminal domain-containing protein n=1 Tax=Araneus ventricosus TaxID=182803 RepID=A0A4Y2M1Z8_ARAVE|nr:hypothetical protein AVEN_261796-1 [Araneus ventricosus]
MRYAHELTKIFLLKQYQKRHPQLFKHAYMDIRQATGKDYYIPSSIASQCIVVDKTYFDEGGCVLLSCFPFRSDGLPCTVTDQMHWSRLGSAYTLSCQPACGVSETTVDAEWRNKTCVQVNPYKKLLAMFPEKFFGVESKHPLHAGLDWKDGHIRLNSTYCKAYGLDFNGYECNELLGQTIIEYLLGTTVYRAIKTHKIQRPSIPPPPPLPKVSVESTDLPINVSDDNPTDLGQFMKELASEVAFDFGVDIAVETIEKILKKRAPKLLSKAANNIPVKTALAHVVLKQYVSMGAKSLVVAGKVLGSVNNVFSLYGIVSVILDIFDPLHFDNVLTGQMVEKINKQLDLVYFQRENNFNPEVTPEFVWEHVLLLDDESDRIEYFASKIREYLEAFHEGETPEDAPPPGFNYEFKQEGKHWEWTVHVVILLMLVILATLFVEWIHVWALAVCLAMVFLKE